MIKIKILMKIFNLLKKENNLQINLIYSKIKHLLLKELKILIYLRNFGNNLKKMKKFKNKLQEMLNNLLKISRLQLEMFKT